MGRGVTFSRVVSDARARHTTRRMRVRGTLRMRLQTLTCQSRVELTRLRGRHFQPGSFATRHLVRHLFSRESGNDGAVRTLSCCLRKSSSLRTSNVYTSVSRRILSTWWEPDQQRCVTTSHISQIHEPERWVLKRDQRQASLVRPPSMHCNMLRQRRD